MAESQQTLHNKLRRSSFLIITHKFATGPSDALLEFLLSKGAPRVLYITHAFHYSPERVSRARLYIDGSLYSIRVGRNFVKMPEILCFLKDFLVTLKYAISAKTRFHYCIGVDPLNAFAGLILRAIKVTRFSVFYTIDYVPQRFSNVLLNSIYHAVDKICVENSDYTWNLSSSMSYARKRRGIRGGRQLLVPMGANRAVSAGSPNFHRKRLVFVGNIRRGQGLELVINGMAELIHLMPEAELYIVGTGPMIGQLKELAKELKIQNHISFIGYLKDHKDIEELVARSAIGVAMYEPMPENFTYYADPGKIKLYLVNGVPVITTRVPKVSAEIEDNCAGIVIRYDKKDFVMAAYRLLSDDEFFFNCKNNAARLGLKYEWPKIFAAAFEILLGDGHNL